MPSPSQFALRGARPLEGRDVTTAYKPDARTARSGMGGFDVAASGLLLARWASRVLGTVDGGNG